MLSRFVVENNTDEIASFNTLKEAITFGESHPQKDELYIVEESNDTGETCKLSFLLEMKEKGELDGVFSLWDIW